MSSPRLSETSYIVLGLLEQAGKGTPYDLKQAAQISTNNFWTVPHTQIYTECARLAGEGLLEEEREASGRRRRLYSLTDRGRADTRRLARRALGGDLRTARREHSEAVLRRRSGDSRRRPARGPWSPPGGIRGAAGAQAAPASRPAAGAGVRDRARARVHPLLEADRAGGLSRSSAEHVLIEGAQQRDRAGAVLGADEALEALDQRRPARRESLARTRSAAPAAASAIASQVARSSRPSASVRPRQSSSGAIPARPIATST